MLQSISQSTGTWRAAMPAQSSALGGMLLRRTSTAQDTPCNPDFPHERTLRPGIVQATAFFARRGWPRSSRSASTFAPALNFPTAGSEAQIFSILRASYGCGHFVESPFSHARSHRLRLSATIVCSIECLAGAAHLRDPARYVRSRRAPEENCNQAHDVARVDSGPVEGLTTLRMPAKAVSEMK